MVTAPDVFQRKYKDETGKVQVPGLRDLPQSIQSNFRNTFIRHIMKLVFSGVSPWSNPSLSVYQDEFNIVYSPLQYHLHTDDAVVIPTNRDLGVLRNQIGAEALMAVIEYLPTQYTKRMLGSKSERATYITTLLESKQRPFVWEYFRPGTIEIPRGEETYYDEKRRGPFQSVPVLRAFSIYFASYGIQMRHPSEDPGRPVGALALAAAAVERGYFLHRSGDYITGTNDFSATNWLRATNMYIDKITNDLTDDNWKAIFNALHWLQESRAHETKVEAGIVLEEREPLLPADPPTPPPA